MMLESYPCWLVFSGLVLKLGALGIQIKALLFTYGDKPAGAIMDTMCSQCNLSIHRSSRGMYNPGLGFRPGIRPNAMRSSTSRMKQDLWSSGRLCSMHAKIELQ